MVYQMVAEMPAPDRRSPKNRRRLPKDIQQ